MTTWIPAAERDLDSVADDVAALMSRFSVCS